MSILDGIRAFIGTSKLMDEALYELVANELAAGVRREGLWLMAVANSDGDIAKAQASYIKYRVASLKDELAVMSSRAGEPKKANISEAESDEMYRQVAEELRSGNVDVSIYTRAYAESGGDEKAANARYISARVDRLLSSVAAEQAAAMAERKAMQEAAHQDRKEQNRKVPADQDLAAAVADGNMMVVKAILEGGAAPSGVDSSGRTLVEIAAKRSDAPMIKLLQKFGAI